MTIKPNLHCGACMADMDDANALTAHLKSCSSAKAILFPITALMFGAADPCHKVAHVCRSVPEAAYEINQYAHAIANEMNSWQRSEIHKKLCAKLGLDYSKFRPFESELITEIPTPHEAEQIIYAEIGRHLRKELISNIPRKEEQS